MKFKETLVVLAVTRMKTRKKSQNEKGVVEKTEMK
jgi:hypothetical protein